MFITTMVKPIMQFFHLIFEILQFPLEKYIRDFQNFITTMIKPIMDFL